MNKCLSCGKNVKNKYCNVSCQNKHQNPNRNNKKYGFRKDFTVKCCKCLKEFVVNEREKLHPVKEKYYCSRKCSNTRTITEETKTKIRNSLTKKINIIKIEIFCKECNKKFNVAQYQKNRKFCSQSCNTRWRNKHDNLGKNGGAKSAQKRFDIKRNMNSNNIKTFIYSLEYPIGNIRYIGKSDNPEKRLKRHIKESKWRNKNHRDHWLNSLDNPPILHIIEEVKYSEWQDREVYWISFYKKQGYKLVNGTDGGEGCNGFKGRKHTDETKQNLSKIGKNRITSNPIKKYYGENNGSCKIKDDDVRNIFVLYFEKKLSAKDISIKYNITKPYVYTIIHGKNRKKIFDEYKDKYNIN
jgi:hypothetical protein